MRLRLTVPIALLVLLLLAPAAASASRYRVGIGDQEVSTFSDPLFQALKLKRIRYLVPWDWDKRKGAKHEANGFLSAATAAHFEPFVTFTATRGCWTGSRYKKTKACKAPSNSAYAREIKSFRKA